MILQTDTRLSKEVNDYGCYLMSILYVTCMRCNIDVSKVSALNVMNILVAGKQARAIGKDCTILAAKNVLVDIICQEFGLENVCKFGYTGVHSQEYIVSGNRFVLGAWRWKFTHFVAMNGCGNTRNDVVYDPLGESYSVRHGTMISTRIYRDL